MTEHNRKYYKKNRKRLLAKAHRLGRKNSWYKKTRDMIKVMARWKTRNLFKSGKISKDYCADCNSVKDLQFHHYDYKKPLVVTILCRECHLRLHRIKKEVK